MFDQRVRKAIAWIVLFGCLAVPLGFEFKEAAGYKARQQTQSSQNRPEKKSDDVVVPDKADDRIARYTFWLAMLTGGLVVVSAVQIFFLIRADKTARIMAETAQRQATTMGSWADAADKQMLLIGQQTDIQRKQHTLGQLQFFATHRPRLHVRHVSLVDPLGRVIDEAGWDHGDDVKGGLVVVNAGGSDATVVHSRYRIFFSEKGLPAGGMPEEETFQQILLPDQILGIGESCAIPLSGKAEMPGQTAATSETRFLRRYEIEHWNVYVMGEIRYRDEGGAERFMGFCRKREADGRFRPVDDPDYEWED